MQPKLRAAAIAIALVLAWIGLALTWERESGADPTSGFASDGARPFLIALALLTPVALAFAIRGGRRLSIVIGLGAAVLVALAGRAAVSLYDAGSAFVSVGPGLGLWLSALGGLLLVLALPPRWALGAVALVAVAVAAAAWPREDRPADGEVAEIARMHAWSFAVDGDTLYVAEAASSSVSAYTGDQQLRDAAELDDDTVAAIAARGSTLYVATGTSERLIRIDSDGGQTALAGRPPEARETDESASQQMELIRGFAPSRLALAPDGTVYVLNENRVYRWRGGEFDVAAGTGVAGLRGDGGPATKAQLDAPKDIAVDGAGRLYIADTGNGRVRRVDVDGTIRTVVGTAAEPRCVTRGGDDAQALDLRRCVGVESLAADSRGNLFLATRGVAYVLGLTPAGRFGVVAGDGVAGWYEGDGRAASARVGHIRALAVGAHDDLFVAEYSPLPRVRRIAAPAGAIGARPGSRGPAPQPVCRAIARWTLNTTQLALVDERDPVALRQVVDRFAADARRLDEVAPDGIDDDTEESVRWITEYRAKLAAFGFDIRRATRTQLVGLQLDGGDGSGGDGESLGDFAEKRCGMLGGMFSVTTPEAKRFCVAYQRFSDANRDADEKGYERARRRALATIPDTVVPPGREGQGQVDRVIRMFTDKLCVVED